MIQQITTIKDGPFFIQFKNGKKVAYCQCGCTSDEENKCDGSHKGCGFKADPQVIYESK